MWLQQAASEPPAGCSKQGISDIPAYRNAGLSTLCGEVLSHVLEGKLALQLTTSRDTLVTL